MIPLLLSLTAVVAYFLGTVSGTELVARYGLRKRLRKGRGTLSYAAMNRNFGARWAWLAALTDIALAVAGAAIGGLLMQVPGDGFPVIGRLFAGFCLVLGDIYPIQRGFRGGKGVLRLMTALWLADWRVGIFACVTLGAVLALTQYVSLASLCACYVGAVAAWIFVDDGQMRGLAGLVVLFSAVVITWRHRGSISKLLGHREPKFIWGRQAESRLREERF